MQDFHGDLLIGGMRLKDVRCELEEERPRGDSTDYMLSGHLHLPPEQLELLQLNREYRIQLEDGRGGQVVLSRIATGRENELLADFVPPKKPLCPQAK
jgi:hypothetical protein